MRMRASTRRALGGPATILAALVLAGACSTSPTPVASPTAEPEPSATSEAPTPTPTPLRWENERLLASYGPEPLAPLTRTDEENDVVFEARELIVERCMSAKGFEPEPELPEFPERPVPTTIWDDQIGLVDLEIAQTYAYNGARDAEWWVRYRERNAALDAQKEQFGSPERTDAEYGEQGCDREAFDTFSSGENPDIDWDLVNSWEDLALEQTWADPAVTGPLDAWRACVATAGYPLTEIPLEKATPDPATPEQVAQAVADVGCKQSSGLVDAFIGTLYAKQQALVDQHLDQFTRAVDVRQAFVQKARDVVAAES